MTWLNPYCFAKHGHHPTPRLAVVRGVCWAIHLTVKLRKTFKNEKKRKSKRRKDKRKETKSVEINRLSKTNLGMRSPIDKQS
jgi:hypothetical protein